jgi:hypothetical protein
MTSSLSFDNRVALAKRDLYFSSNGGSIVMKGRGTNEGEGKNVMFLRF